MHLRWENFFFAVSDKRPIVWNRCDNVKYEAVYFTELRQKETESLYEFCLCSIWHIFLCSGLLFGSASSVTTGKSEEGNLRDEPKDSTFKIDRNLNASRKFKKKFVHRKGVRTKMPKLEEIVLDNNSGKRGIHHVLLSSQDAINLQKIASDTCCQRKENNFDGYCSKISASTYVKSHFMNSVFVQSGIYSCAVDCFLEVSRYLFLPELSKLKNLTHPICIARLSESNRHYRGTQFSKFYRLWNVICFHRALNT